MAVRHSIPIPPFPPELDRDYFGAWVSGFTDGEATFLLDCFTKRGEKRPRLAARFGILLRDDDRPVLELIRSFFGCGVIAAIARRDGSRPGALLRIYRIGDLFNVLVPHYRRFPLMAKKRRDFETWAQGVGCIYRHSLKSCRGRRGLVGAGALPKWTAEEVAEFRTLSAVLKAGRVYNAAAVELPAPRPPRPEPPSLFDGLP